MADQLWEQVMQEVPNATANKLTSFDCDDDESTKQRCPQDLSDAVMVPERMKSGSRQIDRINSILAVSEPLLGVNRVVGERAYVRRQGDGWLFITKDPSDTLYGTVGSRCSGEPRYDWVELGNGIRVGYLKPGEKRLG